MKYTKKQITEAIRYWQDVLRRMDESNPYTPGRINSWMAHGMNPSYEPSAVARREEQQKTQELRRLETEVNQRFDIEGYTIRLQPDRYGRNRYAELVFVSPNAQETRMLSNVEEQVPEARDVLNWLMHAKRYTVRPEQVYIKRR